MRYFDYDEEEIQRGNKVPYDAEPIARSRNYKQPSPKQSGTSKVVVFLLVILIAFNVVLGFLFLKSNMGETGRVTVENYYDIYNDSVSSSYMVSKALPSSVCIASGYNDTVTSSNISYSNFQQMNSKGSGVITSINKANGDMTIVTCEHVVTGNTNAVYVLLFDSYRPIKATYVGGIRSKDIAVLKVSGSSEVKNSSALAAEVADSMYVSMGDMVLAIGNPMSGGFDTCMGHIRKPQTLVTVTNVGVERVISTDAPINSGNSGGGLFNAKGQLIGIVNAKIESDTIDCVSFAIPSNLAMSIAGSIERNYGDAKHAVLGVEFATSDETRDSQDLDGIVLSDTVFVQSVVDGSAADKAGLQKNDIVIGFSYHDNVVVDMLTMYSFEDHAYNMNVGDKVTFTVKRGSSTLNFTVTIAQTV
ncbi:MAG: trypsin-like peptidase domain-containing protein [Clostridia bacterium]|nr:trypsin-like peptidase domain-containing protein [Clostridia bacterium]